MPKIYILELDGDDLDLVVAAGSTATDGPIILSGNGPYNPFPDTEELSELF